jgi:hypothetical protein
MRCRGGGCVRACETPPATMEATSVVWVTTELATSTEVAYVAYVAELSCCAVVLVASELV